MKAEMLWTWGLLGMAGLGGWIGALAAGGEQKPDRPALDSWRLAEPVVYENLSVFPVVSESGGGLQRTRDSTLVWPPPGGPQVNQLVLVNRGSKPLMLLAGELLSGGKQDRIIAKDRIVAPGSPPLPLDVFCVEHGRWSAGMAFASARMFVHPSVRERAAVDQEQAGVWGAVRRGTTGSRAADGQAGAPARLSADALQTVILNDAPTESYKRIIQSPQVGQSVESFAEEVERRFAHATAGLKGEAVVGVVVAYGGEVAWSDVFASPALFERYWHKLLRSYVVEALARPQLREHASLNDAREFLRPLTGRETTESESGVYRWRQVSEGRYAEIALEALQPTSVMLHWMKIHRHV